MQTIVTASDAADLLALVPRLTGFSRPGSIVLIAFAGTRSCGALRYDAPAGLDTGRSLALVSSMIGMLCRVDGADAVVPVVYPAEPESGGAEAYATAEHPLAGFIAEFVELAERQGFAVPQALWQSRSAWGTYLGDDRASHPIAAVHDATAAMPIITWPVDALEVATSAGVDVAVREEVARVLAAIEAGGDDSDGAAGAAALADPIGFIESLLGRDPAQVLPAEIALTVLLLRDRPVRDGVMMQLAFGEGFGAQVLRDSLEFLGDARTSRRRGRPQRDHSSALVEASQRLLGETGSPDRDRLVASLAFLSRVTSAVEIEQACDAYTVLAWLHWALGRASIAHELLQRVLIADPSHSLSELVRTLLVHGRLPEWIFGRP